MCLALAKAELADSTEYDYFKTLAKEYIKQTEANMSKFHHRHDESIVCGTSGSLLAGIYVQHHFGCVEHQSVLEFHRIISRSDSQVNEVLSIITFFDGLGVSHLILKVDSYYVMKYHALFISSICDCS